MKRFFFLALFAAVLTASVHSRAQAPVAIAAPTGVWVNMIGIAERPQPVTISRRASGGPWMVRTRIQPAESYQSFMAGYLAAQAGQPADETLPDGALRSVWERFQSSGRKIEALATYASSLHILAGVGAAWFDDSAVKGSSYEYKIELQGGREMTTAAVRFPAPGGGVARLAPSLIQSTRAGVYLEFDVLDAGTMRTARVYRGYHKRTRPSLIHPDMSFTTRDRKTVLMFTDATAVPKMGYTYTVVPVDEAGNEGTPSPAAVVLNTPPATLPPSVHHLTAQSVESRRAIRLSWLALRTPDVVSLELYRSETYTGAYKKMASLSPSDTEYYDQAVQPIQPYYYTIAINGTMERSVNAARTLGILRATDSNWVAPYGITAKPEGKTVLLTWQRSEADTRGYYLYRGTGYRGELRKVRPLIASADGLVTFRDTLPTVGVPTVFSYAVSDENTSYAEGPLSERVTVQVMPSADESVISVVPTARVIPADDGAAQIIWNDLLAAGADVRGYRIYRSVRDAAGTVVEKESLLTTTALGPSVNLYADRSLMPGRSYTYTVRAVVRGGEGSASLPAGYTVPMETPLAPTSIEAVSTGGAVDLSWAVPVGMPLKRVAILRAKSGAEPKEVASLGADAAAWQDKDVKAGELYHYFFQTQSAAGATSLLTSPVSVRVR